VLFRSRNFNILTDVNGDDLSIPAAPDRIAIDRYSQTADNSVLSEMYSSYYQGIARANELLVNIEGAPVPEPVRLQAEGEARFLRGFYYFYLVRWFGNIPMPLTPISNAEDVQLQSSVVDEEEVYEQIIIDLTAAIENLPITYGDAELGRASKGAARTLLAKVHMTRQDWPAAKIQLEEVIASGEYELVETYHEIFYPENGNRTEHIFMLQHLQNSSSGSLSGGYMTSFFPVNSTLSFGTFIPTTGTTGIFSAYEEGDHRKNLYLTLDGTFTYKDRMVASQGILY